MRILLLEDDKLICENIKTYFDLKGICVDFYNDGVSLLENSNLDCYDIVLLDINTPKKSGFETLKEIRDDGSDIPAIFLTAQNDIEHIKKGYELGCNDYLKKPFILDELYIRIEKILHTEVEKVVRLSQIYSFDMDKNKILKNGEVLEVNKKIKDLLYILTKNIGSVVSTESIISYIWDGEVIADNTLRTLVKKSRETLGENFINNLRNQGYKIEIYEK